MCHSLEQNQHSLIVAVVAAGNNVAKSVGPTIKSDTCRTQKSEPCDTYLVLTQGLFCATVMHILIVNDDGPPSNKVSASRTKFSSPSRRSHKHTTSHPPPVLPHRTIDKSNSTTVLTLHPLPNPHPSKILPHCLRHPPPSTTLVDR